MESVTHSVIAIDGSSCRKIRSFDILHQFIDGYIVIVDILYRPVDNFGQVVRRHIGCHPYGNSRCTVYQKIGHTCWKHSGLFQGIVKVELVVNGVFINIGQ